MTPEMMRAEIERLRVALGEAHAMFHAGEPCEAEAQLAEAQAMRLSYSLELEKRTAQLAEAQSEILKWKGVINLYSQRAEDAEAREAKLREALELILGHVGAHSDGRVHAGCDKWTIGTARAALAAAKGGP